MSARAILLFLLALAYFGFGWTHLLAAHVLMPMVKFWVPYPREVILFTGACEIAGGSAWSYPAVGSRDAGALRVLRLAGEPEACAEPGARRPHSR